MKINLPTSTLLNKFIPKNIFFKNVVVNSKMKAEFTDKIQKITWKYKISQETLWVTKTDIIEEIEIFEILLKQRNIPKNILKIIDKSIPYRILYIFKYQDDFSYGITLKWEKVWNYYFSQWNEDIDFDFEGSDMEKVFENIIKKFLTNIDTQNKNFDEIIKTDTTRISLKKEIEKLNSKIQKEKQFNKKVELNRLVRDYKRQLAQIN